MSPVQAPVGARLLPLRLLLHTQTMNAFEIFLDGEHIDTVFSTETDAEVMRQQLINHDGFDPRITVTMKGA